MLYIHELHQLSVKSADIESLTILRELRKELSVPFSSTQLKEHFSQFFVSQTELDHIDKAKELLPLTISAVEHLKTYPTRLYEDDNLERAIRMLRELPEPLARNYFYAKSIAENQDQLVEEVTAILNGIKSHQNLLELNQKLNGIFGHLLRNTTFSFKSTDIIDEGCKARVQNLLEGLEQGLFFTQTVESQIKKEHFAMDALNIPPQEKIKVDSIQKQIIDIKKGITCAYAVNFRMVEWVVILYSLVKFAQQ